VREILEDFPFLPREKVDDFPFPSQGNSRDFPYFPSEGKSRDFSRFSLGKKKQYIYFIYTEDFSLMVNGERKAAESKAAVLPSPIVDVKISTHNFSNLMR
jgi:hypothetical protein